MEWETTVHQKTRRVCTESVVARCKVLHKYLTR